MGRGGEGWGVLRACGDAYADQLIKRSPCARPALTLRAHVARSVLLGVAWRGAAWGRDGAGPVVVG